MPNLIYNTTFLLFRHLFCIVSPTQDTFCSRQRDSPSVLSPFCHLMLCICFVLFGFVSAPFGQEVVAEIALISLPATPPAASKFGHITVVCGRPRTDGIGLIAARRGSGCGLRIAYWVRCLVFGG